MNLAISAIVDSICLYPTAHKIEALVKQEVRYGTLPEYSPAVNDVLEYIKPVSHALVNK